MTPTGPQRRGSAAITALTTGLVTAALLAGVPYVLWQAGGDPWPSTVNSLSDLAGRLEQPLTDPLALDLLSLGGWVCWAAFALSFLRESWWYATHLPHLVRDRAAHYEHLTRASLKGSLAALCVGTLVVAVLTVWRPPTAAAQQHALAESASRGQITSSAPHIPTPLARKADTDDGSTGGGGYKEAQDGGQTYTEYTVVEGDCLWDIAQEHLGDSVRWPRIFVANRDRIQPDGQRLTDPNDLLPGWRLRLPTSVADAPPSAESPSKTVPPAASAPRQGAAPEPRTPALGADQRQRQEGEGHEREHAHKVSRGSAAISVGEAGVIGITTAAGLLAALRLYRFHQRRRALSNPEPVPEELADQPENLATVVQQATQAAREADLPRTTPGSDELLTRRTPPPPPQPAHAVALGTRDEAEVLLEELAATRICTWTGPGAEDALRALLINILTAAERQRPQPPRVTAALPRALAARLLPPLPSDVSGLTQAADMAQVIQAGQEHLLARARHHDLEPQGNCEGRLPQPAADESPTGQPQGPETLLLITDQVSGQDAELAALFEQAPSGTLTVLTLDVHLPRADRWNIDHDGTATFATTNSTGKQALRLFHVTKDASQQFTALLLGAQGHPPHHHSEATPGRTATADGSKERSPGNAEEEDDGDDEAPADLSPNADSQAGHEQDQPSPCPPGKAAEQREAAAPVRLQLLGPITLYARDSDEPIGNHLRPEAREFLALLASHPAGLLARDIADNLRLGGGADQHAKELKNLRRSIRRTLRAATGLPHAEFIHLSGELHKLAAGFIDTDIAAFRAKIKKLSTVTGNGCIMAVREIVDDYRGPFCQGFDLVWADGIRESFARQAADAVIRAARQAETEGSQQARHLALDLLDRLISFHPDTEALYQHAIRLNQAAGHPEAAHHTYEKLARHLAELGLEPDAATHALVKPHLEAPPSPSRAGAAGIKSRASGARAAGRGEEKQEQAPRLSRR
ncbi:BTAD domain-containing putative transcriptional regulator [Streptomyces diacarni]|uniref:BTAD domain-containing putative transcriptional regulator n=1 Tax=Streptomyces diacarni TaxID=2800381 RepID=UPI0033FAFCE2